MRVTTGLQHTPAVRMMGSAMSDHVELDFAATVDSRDCFGQEVVCSWDVDDINLS